MVAQRGNTPPAPSRPAVGMLPPSPQRARGDSLTVPAGGGLLPCALCPCPHRPQHRGRSQLRGSDQDFGLEADEAENG